MATDANAAVASAKQTLRNADNFGQRETGNKKAGDPAPVVKPKAEKSDYSTARAARSTLGDEVASAAAGLKAKQDNVDQYNAAQ